MPSIPEQGQWQGSLSSTAARSTENLKMARTYTERSCFKKSREKEKEYYNQKSFDVKIKFKTVFLNII